MEQPLSLLVAFSNDDRRVRQTVKMLAELVLHQSALLLDDDDLFEPRREIPYALRLERPRHCNLVEIGRASCRERVCQYVWISVVAVSLKKKNKSTTIVIFNTSIQ